MFQNVQIGNMNKFLLSLTSKPNVLQLRTPSVQYTKMKWKEEPEEEDVTSFKFPSTSWRNDRPVRVEPNIPPGGGVGPALPQTTKRNNQDADCKNCL